jgi:hypothetical protein
MDAEATGGEHLGASFGEAQAAQVQIAEPGTSSCCNRRVPAGVRRGVGYRFWR